MGYKNYEANYLISLLSSTLNERMPPTPVRALEWRDLYYLAEYHNVTNISYYSLIGFYDHVPNLWRDRFYKVLRKWVTVNNTQEKECQLVLKGLEEKKIDHMFLKDWTMKYYYPQAEMRVVDDIQILIRPGEERAVIHMMRELGYRFERLPEGSLSFYKSVWCRIIFCQKLLPKNRQLYPYYKKVWKRLKHVSGSESRYTFAIDDFFIYMVSEVCDKYAKGQIDIRHIIDIHLFLKKHKELMNHIYIDTELTRLELYKMEKMLENLGDIWFGVYEGDSTRDIKDVEDYLWSKGVYARETSARLLPMVIDMETWQVHDAKVQKIMKTVHWIFPNIDNVKAKFPVVERVKLLLPICWILRLIYMANFYLKIRIMSVYRIIIMKKHEKKTGKSITDLVPKDSE